MTVQRMTVGDVLDLFTHLHPVTLAEIERTGYEPWLVARHFMVQDGWTLAVDGAPVACCFHRDGLTWLALGDGLDRYYRGVVRGLNRLMDSLKRDFRMRKLSEHPQSDRFLRLLGFRPTGDENWWVREK